MGARTHRKRNANSGVNASSPPSIQGSSSRLGWWPLLSALMLWAAFPPIGLSSLAWVAPLGWLHCVEKFPAIGRRGYWTLWISGCVFWLLILQGVRLAYWPLYLGWIALSLYLAVYIPLFVAATRVLRSRWRFPLVLAAPIAWVGLEIFRSYFLTGFSTNTIAHSQVHHPLVIQIADQFGGYGISYVMLTFSAGLYQAVAHWRRASLTTGRAAATARVAWPLGFAMLMLVATLAYGQWRITQADRLYASRPELLRVLLIQENTPTQFESDLNSLDRAWLRYLETTRSAVAKFRDFDLLVWPESTFGAGRAWIDPDLPKTLPKSEMDEQQQREAWEDFIHERSLDFETRVGLLLAAATGRHYALGAAIPSDGPHLLLGSDAAVVTSKDVESYNSALWVGPNGVLLDRYDKMHIVMFGEYIPLGPVLQWLRDIFSFPGLKAGKQPKCFQVGEVRIAPNICFESMMPRILSWQVRELVRQGTPPDVLINITNDSWFRGSSILDHHLACSILCAVENRRPLLVGANTGISAEIDGAGRLIQATERFAVGGILASPKLDSRGGIVQMAGYPFAWLCLALMCSSALHNLVSKRKSSSPTESATLAN